MSATVSPVTGSPANLPSPVELLFADFVAEHAATRRLLERFPDPRADWRPHAKSRTLAELSTHVADIPNRGVSILSTEEVDVTKRQPMTPLTTREALVAHHDASVSRLETALRGVDYPALAANWTMRAGPQVLVSAPRRLLLRRVMMSHLVHHRAQLGVYLRLLDIAIPGMYGPSADE